MVPKRNTNPFNFEISRQNLGNCRNSEIINSIFVCNYVAFSKIIVLVMIYRH